MIKRIKILSVSDWRPSAVDGIVNSVVVLSEKFLSDEHCLVIELNGGRLQARLLWGIDAPLGEYCYKFAMQFPLDESRTYADIQGSWATIYTRDYPPKTDAT